MYFLSVAILPQIGFSCRRQDGKKRILAPYLSFGGIEDLEFRRSKMRAMESVYIINEESQNRLGESKKQHDDANDGKVVLSTQWGDQPDYFSDKWKWKVELWEFPNIYRIQNVASGRFLGQVMNNDNVPTVANLSNGDHIGCSWIISKGKGNICHIQAFASQYYLCEKYKVGGCNYRGDCGIELKNDINFARWSFLVPLTPA